MENKPKPTSYCEFAANLEPGHVHRVYHDRHYGFPIEDDNELFGRLILEINQAGLSWTTILNKQENFRRAYDNFNPVLVALYGEADRQRLLGDAGIIRNRLKIDAAIHNAGVVLDLQKEYGSFKNWLDAHHPEELTAWVKIFKKTFRFTGGEIVNEFLMSTGYLPGAHHPACPVSVQIEASAPPWMR